MADSDKSADAYRTISEVSESLGVPQHVLRFWETKFPQVNPLKRGGNRRYYRPDDVALLRVINRLLYTDGLTIRGVQKLLKDRGVRALIAESDRPPAQEHRVGAAIAEDGESATACMPAAVGSDMSAPCGAPVGLSKTQAAELRAIRDLLARALDEVQAG